MAATTNSRQRDTDGEGGGRTSAGLPLFHEEQRFRQWWVWTLVLGVAALGWWTFVQQIIVGRPFGNNPGPDWLVWLLWLLIGLGLPLFFVQLRLVLQVTSDGILIRFRPF